MSEKMLNVRIVHKHDTAENWAKATGFIPKTGELIIYDIDENYNYSRFKIGDGVRTINDLEFSQTDLTGYATENFVNEGLETRQPVGDYALKSDIVGKNVAVSIGNQIIISGKGAEIFNDYENNEATGDYSHAEGEGSHAEGRSSHAEGGQTHAAGIFSHAEGLYSYAQGNASHAEGTTSHAAGEHSHAEGFESYAQGSASHAEGYRSHAAGERSHAEGENSIATGDYSHAEGFNITYPITVTGAANSTTYTLSEYIEHIRSGAKIFYNNAFSTISDYNSDTLTITVTPSLSSEDLNEQLVTLCFGAFGTAAHTEGYNTLASGEYSHAQGYETTASGENSHAEGRGSHAQGYYSHAEGNKSIAQGFSSHAEGESYAQGNYSHAEGDHSHAVGRSQHTQGEYNLIDPEYNSNTPGERAKYAHIVGNGASDRARSNAHTLDWNGNAWFAGNIYIGGTGQDDTAAIKIAIVPFPTEADEGKFLRVINGVPTWVSIPNAEEATF